MNGRSLVPVFDDDDGERHPPSKRKTRNAPASAVAPAPSAMFDTRIFCSTVSTASGEQLGAHSERIASRSDFAETWYAVKSPIPAKPTTPRTIDEVGTSGRDDVVGKGGGGGGGVMGSGFGASANRTAIVRAFSPSRIVRSSTTLLFPSRSKTKRCGPGFTSAAIPSRRVKRTSP